mgnify:FL=1
MGFPLVQAPRESPFFFIIFCIFIVFLSSPVNENFMYRFPGLEKNRRIFEETFAGIEKMREEMKRSASEVETFMKDPVKSIFPGEAKETAAEPGSEDTAEEAEEEDEIVENSAVIDLENEPDYLDDDNDEEEDEIPNRAHDEEDEEE